MLQGLHDQALEDCEQALQLNENNYRAQYRKARCLKELGRHQEAYDVIAKCSMAVPQVSLFDITLHLKMYVFFFFFIIRQTYISKYIMYAVL